MPIHPSLGDIPILSEAKADLRIDKVTIGILLSVYRCATFVYDFRALEVYFPATQLRTIVF
jgi:hypothetical protein